MFPKIGLPQNGWLKIMETPIKMEDFGGYHHLRKHPIPYTPFTNHLQTIDPNLPTGHPLPAVEKNLDSDRVPNGGATVQERVGLCIAGGSQVVLLDVATV